jgi:hypothetical protein
MRRELYSRKLWCQADLSKNVESHRNRVRQWNLAVLSEPAVQAESGRGCGRNSGFVPEACGGTFSTCRKQQAPEVNGYVAEGLDGDKALNRHVENVPPQAFGTDAQSQGFALG